MNEEIVFNFCGQHDPKFVQEVGWALDEIIRMEAQVAQAEQELLGEANQAQPVGRALDGIGSLQMSIHPMAYIHYKVNERLDFSSAKDRKWLLDRHPDMAAVGQHTVKTGVGWTVPLESWPSNKRETVNYGTCSDENPKPAGALATS